MSSNVVLRFFAEGLEGALVRGLSVRDGINELFCAEVLVELPSGAATDPRSFVGRQVMVLVESKEGETERRYGGYATKVREQLLGPTRTQRFTVTLESPLVALRYSRDSRIFQEKTSKDIVSQVLTEHGLAVDGVAWRLASDPPVREVCTQLDEPALDFVRRILAEDGIFFFLEHGGSGSVVVFGDAPSSYGEVAPKIVPFAASDLSPRLSIREIATRSRVRPAKVVLRDHDFQRPQLDLEASHEDDAPLGLEHYDHPGRYVDPAEGKRRAQLRHEAFAAHASGATGSGEVVGLGAGHVFTLEGAPDGALDGDWVVAKVETSFESRGEGVVIRSRFDVVRSDVALRPQLGPQPPEAGPSVPGPQVARVVGPAGEEIHCDEHGRVKVSYPWDRRSTEDDKASQWVRVGQMHTSGSVVIPRVGWEVLIDYEDGDPDEAVVLGRLYNGVFRPPYKLPDGKKSSTFQSLSTPGGGGQNEIRMDDTSGKEGMALTAQKDMNIVIANNKTETVADLEDVAIGANHTLTVGGDETVSIGTSHDFNVGASQTWSVGGSRSKTITGGETVSVKGGRTLDIGGSHTTLTPASVASTTSGALSETIGGSAIDLSAEEVSTAVAGAASFSVGGVRLDLAGGDKGDNVLGAKATNVGGALLALAGGDVGVAAKGVKATNVGGAWMLNAGSTCDLSANTSLTINVGGAFLLTGAKVVLKVGGSSVTIAGGQVKFDSPKVEIIATGPHAEVAPVVADK